MLKSRKTVRFESTSKKHDGINFIKRYIISIVDTSMSNKKSRKKKLSRILSRISTDDKYQIFMYFINLKNKILRTRRCTPLFSDIYTTYYFKNTDVIIKIIDKMKKNIRKDLRLRRWNKSVIY